jgi:hypothetical protein
LKNVDRRAVPVGVVGVVGPADELGALLDRVVVEGAAAVVVEPDRNFAPLAVGSGDAEHAVLADGVGGGPPVGEGQERQRVEVDADEQRQVHLAFPSSHPGEDLARGGRTLAGVDVVLGRPEAGEALVGQEHAGAVEGDVAEVPPGPVGAGVRDTEAGRPGRQAATRGAALEDGGGGAWVAAVDDASHERNPILS